MKLVVLQGNRLGVVDPDRDRVVDISGMLPSHSPSTHANYWVAFCEQFAGLRDEIERGVRTAPGLSLRETKLQAPVLSPTKIVAAASNYAEHVEEMRPRDVDAWMLDFDVFLKAPSSIADPASSIVLPKVSGEIHYEAELAFVIGAQARHVSKERALEHVLGYTLLIDVTQRGKGDRSRRKSYDGFAPVGPWIVTADEAPPWQDITIRMRLNGEVRQDVRAGDMLVGIPEIIEHASAIMTLEPGDVVTTGAPPGVGALSPGDHVTVEGGGIGNLEVDIV